MPRAEAQQGALKASTDALGLIFKLPSPAEIRGDGPMDTRYSGLPT